jgi:hypothetical protein
MLWLYCALICLKIDYGSFLCSFAAESRLSVIDPVHNSGIQFSSGSFHTGWLECLCGIWRTSSFLAEESSPVFLWTKLATQHSHPSYGVIFYLTHCNRYGLYVTAPQPAGVHFHNLLQHVHIHVLCPIRLSPILSWHTIQTIYTLQIAIHMRGEMSALMYCQFFAELMSSYLDYTVVYADG